MRICLCALYFMCIKLGLQLYNYDMFALDITQYVA